MTGGHRFGNLNIFFNDVMVYGGARRMFSVNKYYLMNSVLLKIRRRR
jgi:hypothetical protein